jgi:uncharacterized protein YndB with AHSA1/START domain
MTSEAHFDGDRAIVITRVVNAPRDRVWSVWTDAGHLAKWWGPDGFTITTERLDVRTGGDWKFVMHGPDGTDYPNWIRFTEVKKPDFMRHEHGATEGDIQFTALITFEDQGQKTKITMRSEFPTAEARDHVVREYHAVEGGKQTLAKLAAYAESL